MEFMEAKEENGYDMIIILFMTLNMVWVIILLLYDFWMNNMID